MHDVRIGIGGWDFAPWRGLFYPKGLKKAEELGFASAHLTSIEVNGTFYRTQTPETFRSWRDGTPDGFVFSIKANRAAAIRKDPAEAAPAIEHFLGSGVTELGDKLGAILWQLPGGRKFDADALPRFLDLLPAERDGVKFRHALEAQHESFGTEAVARLLSERGIARVILDKEGVAPREDITADFVYLRLQGTVDEQPAGYEPEALDAWAKRLKTFAKTRDVFAYVISGAKHRAPAAAMGLIERVK
ncbi:DUF72 domain-containing protein [Lichenihabitans sp. PAMC28606]|uniref:DUF72 domain-containing protein n=1 Tax=Lichenihabitans sp. PAMC28606 TaxID=2880932 RepID=UPI001D0A2092|nr:DUF72 domain-containing protein [Lichenihabitans sp. PAMC28606]UDL96285.1 DUF72 domain-containing protein [Lichenihabitans sp. PAMC28606]